jgi:hypothetical protein
MGYRFLADATVVVHFAFLIYVVLGGFLAWRRPRMIWPHLAAASWGLLIITNSVECPLTYLENWARERGGEQGLGASGFVDTYVKGVIYPAQYTQLLQLLVVACVLVSWSVPLRRLHRGPHRKTPTDSKPRDSVRRH